MIILGARESIAIRSERKKEDAERKRGESGKGNLRFTRESGRRTSGGSKVVKRGDGFPQGQNSRSDSSKPRIVRHSSG